MIRKKLSEDELFFLECFYNPKCMVECLYPKGAMNTWLEGEDCITVRTYQIPFLAYDCCIEDDDRLSEQENFEIRIAIGTRYIILGRRLGKSFLALIGNMLLKLIHYSDKELTMAAHDEKRVNKILNKVRDFFIGHPFFRQ